MTASAYYTNQFYAWEYRGRGWHLSDEPIDIEPPFIPYFRHGYPQEQIDDGKRHTLVSKFLEHIQGKKEPPYIQQDTLDYDSLECFQASDSILSALHIILPKDAKPGLDTMRTLLSMLSSLRTQLSFEIIGTASDIRIQFVCPAEYCDVVETYLTIYFPLFTVFRNDHAIVSPVQDDLYTLIIDFGLQHEFYRPIQKGVGGIADPLTALLGALDRLQDNEQAGLQILFQPVVNRWDESILRSVTMYDGSSFFHDEPNAPHIATEKVQTPLYAVVVRTFAQAPTPIGAQALWERISAPIVLGSRGIHNELVPLITDAYGFSDRFSDVSERQSHRLGMLLNLDELLTLVHFPTNPAVAKKLFTAHRTTKAVPAIAIGKPFVLGTNIHLEKEMPVTCDIDQRVRHTHIIGATGTGKSTLIVNLVLQDIAQGIGIVVFDPHGDVVDDIIARVPAERVPDVVFVDPSDIDYPIGVNILQAFSDTEKELLSSDLVAIFKRYATSWGDQMSAVLGNAIHALLESKEGGSLHDLRRFLIEKEFRQSVLRTVADPAIRYYWQKEYPLSKTNSIGPILTRLDTFLRPKAIRNMVSQQSGLDFTALLNSNKIILLKLSQGLIGKENSFLLGSLILSKIHQAILKRQEQAVRNPVCIYLDEFQNFITPSVREMVTGIRKYNAGLILSHQGLQDTQKDDAEVLNSVVANSSIRIVFRVGDADAKRLQDGFSGFDASDLQNLARGEAIIRIDQPQYDCSLTTIPLDPVSVDVAERKREAVASHSRHTYASSKAAVEKLLFDSLDTEREIIETKAENIFVPKERTKPEPPAPAPVVPEPIQEMPEKDISTHRYLQMLVKNMGEAAGYVATLEMPITGGTGQVDVLLQKERRMLAVEICNTTDAEWEMHNISKCLEAAYDEVISLSGDLKQLEKIKSKCIAAIPDFAHKPVSFLTPDALFAHLHGSGIHQQSGTETSSKGYRVNVTYDAITQEEMNRKRATVAQVVAQSLRKKRPK